MIIKNISFFAKTFQRLILTVPWRHNIFIALFSSWHFIKSKNSYPEREVKNNEIVNEIPYIWPEGGIVGKLELTDFVL